LAYAGTGGLRLLRNQDELTPKTQAQETPIFLKTNILLATIREEEKGGREDWEFNIPRTPELLEANATAELTELLHELKPDSEDRKKMSAVTRKQINAWQHEEIELQRLMADDTTEGYQSQKTTPARHEFGVIGINYEGCGVGRMQHPRQRKSCGKG
jgi:hypothetical protein